MISIPGLSIIYIFIRNANEFPPTPETRIQSLPFWWPYINSGTRERTLKDLHAVFPRSGDMAHWKPQSTSLAISGACLNSRVEGWEQVPVLSQ